MPLFMDHHHHIDGLTKKAIMEAHQKDLQTQAKYGVKFLNYWFDEGTGQAFCLAEGPTKEAVAKVHRESHGLLADDITQVQQGS